jgi:parallel beta-helix repeat protein
MELFRKTASGILLFLLLVSTLTLAFNIQPVKAEGTIYIRADGSVDPPTAPILNVGNIYYTFTADIYGFIVVQRSNIIVDGNAHTLQGPGGNWTYGFSCSGLNNVTIKNTNIRNFTHGILLIYSSYNCISGNNITANPRQFGIYLDHSSYNCISGNNIANNWYGIWLESSLSNKISENNITNNSDGIYLYGSSSNSISGNNITKNVAGIVLAYSSNFNSVSGNNITASVTAGIWLYESSDNVVCHNNFIDNVAQVYDCAWGYPISPSINVWDDGYPSGGNYWSDYTGVDANGDGIGDTPYIIDANNRDHYPLMKPFRVEHRTWYVDDDLQDYPNADFTKIQDAVDAAEAGDIIVVYPGTYTENVDVYKSLAIKSESGAEMTIVQAANSNDHVFEVTANYVEINGFTVKGSKGSAKLAGVYLENAHHCKISNNNAANNLCGIYLYSSTNNTLRNNNAHSNIAYGIFIDRSIDNIITDNTAKSNDHCGIWLEASPNNALTNNVMSENKYNFAVGGYAVSHYINAIDTSNKVNGKPVVYLIGKKDLVIDSSWDIGYLGIINSTNITVKDLTLTNNAQGVLFAGVERSCIKNVNIINNLGGIELYCYSSNNSISNNSILNNYYGIILCYSSNNNVITNNNIYSNSYNGIYPAYSTNNEIYLNNFINNYYNAYSHDSTNIWSSPAAVTYIYNGRVYTSYLGNYWTDYIGDDADGDGIGDAPYSIDSDKDIYPLIEPFENYILAQTWFFDSDFQYNLDDNYGTVEGTGHLSGTATLSAGILSVEGQITLNGPLPSGVPEVYLTATDGQDKELAKQTVDLSSFSYWQTAPNTYNFTGQIPNVTQPINNGHYEAQALITYNAAKYEFFVNTASLINSHYFPLTTPPTPPAKFRIGDWVQTTANLNVREDPGLSYTIIGTMPLGTTGQIVGGPVEADGFVWWNVEYAVGVRGWSAENWLELYPVLEQPPTCVVKLQKDGAEIHEIDVGEFFDIYVGGSIGVKGIKQVRFSSDDVREGYPTGEWTEWYDWDVSSGDWDTATKIKRWAFATPGYKEVWAEVKDEKGYTAVGFATIFVPAPALPVLTSPLIITPVKDIYNVEDSLEAEFTIKNVGDIPITLDVLTVGGRLNGWFVVDFTFQSVTLQPNEPYQYQGSLTLNQTGNYRFFVAYHIENPTPNEKRLLDENNWNTCVELGEGLTHNDRVKNIIVFEEDIVPEDVIQLRNLIDRLKGLDTYIPPYLLDDKSFGGSVATLWMYWKSFFTDAWETYDMHYFAGLDYEYLRVKSLILAGDSLDRGDIENARKLVQMSIEFGELSVKSFQGAFEVYDRNIEQVESIARFVKDRSQALAKGIVTVVFNPTAGKALDYFFLITDYLINRELLGVEEAKKIAIRDGVIKFLYNEWAFFDDMTLSEAVKVNPPFKLLTLQDYIKSSKTLPDELYDVIVLWIYGDVASSLSKKIADLLSGGIDYLQAKEFSPVELRAYNSQGKIVGVVDGEVRHEIPRSMYYNGTVTIFFPSDTYRFEVAGTDEGTYSLEITSVEAGNVTVFTATDISTSPNATHQYIIDWAALSAGEEGVTVMVDSDGDDLFEKTLTSDSELTDKEFMFPMRAIFTFDAFWEDVNYPVILSSSNSTITNFIFNQPSKQISFEVSGEKGNSGYCNVTIPKTLLRGEPWAVRVNGTDWNFTSSGNETHSFLYFTYTHGSTLQVVIQGTWVIPEFPSTMILPLFMLTTLIATVLLKKKRRMKP